MKKAKAIKKLNVRGVSLRENLDQLPSQVITDKLLPGGCQLNDGHVEEVIEWLKNVKKEIDKCSDEEEDIEELIKRRASELPKDYVDQVLP